MKTNSIKLVFYDSLVAKTNYRNTAIFQSRFSFSLIPPWLEVYLSIYDLLSPPGANVRLSPSKKICIIRLIGSPLQMMKNTFYFILKALSVLKMFKFLL